MENAMKNTRVTRAKQPERATRVAHRKEKKNDSVGAHVPTGVCQIQATTKLICSMILTPTPTIPLNQPVHQPPFSQTQQSSLRRQMLKDQWQPSQATQQNNHPSHTCGPARHAPLAHHQHPASTHLCTTVPQSPSANSATTTLKQASPNNNTNSERQHCHPVRPM